MDRLLDFYDGTMFDHQMKDRFAAIPLYNDALRCLSVGIICGSSSNTDLDYPVSVFNGSWAKTFSIILPNALYVHEKYVFEFQAFPLLQNFQLNLVSVLNLVAEEPFPELERLSLSSNPGFLEGIPYRINFTQMEPEQCVFPNLYDLGLSKIDDDRSFDIYFMCGNLQRFTLNPRRMQDVTLDAIVWPTSLEEIAFVSYPVITGSMDDHIIVALSRKWRTLPNLRRLTLQKAFMPNMYDDGYESFVPDIGGGEQYDGAHILDILSLHLPYFESLEYVSLEDNSLAGVLPPLRHLPVKLMSLNLRKNYLTNKYLNDEIISDSLNDMDEDDMIDYEGNIEMFNSTDFIASAVLRNELGISEFTLDLTDNLFYGYLDTDLMSIIVEYGWTIHLEDNSVWCGTDPDFDFAPDDCYHFHLMSGFPTFTTSKCFYSEQKTELQFTTPVEFFGRIDDEQLFAFPGTEQDDTIQAVIVVLTDIANPFIAQYGNPTTSWSYSVENDRIMFVLETFDTELDALTESDFLQEGILPNVSISGIVSIHFGIDGPQVNGKKILIPFTRGLRHRVCCGGHEHRADDLCYVCEPGTVAPSYVGAEGTWPIDYVSPPCEPCANGTFAKLAGLDSCTTCERGYECPDITQEGLPCAAGTYQNYTGQSFCHDCLVGQYADTVASFECVTCDAGYECPSRYEEGTECKPGYYQPDASQTACLMCPAGSYLPVGFEDYSGATRCFQCNAGFYCASTVENEQLCPLGTYSVGGQTECTTCAPGKFTIEQGQEVCEECLSGQYCEDNISFGQLCREGTYQPQHSQTSCLECGTEFTTERSGATAEDECICRTGTYFRWVDADNAALICDSNLCEHALGSLTCELEDNNRCNASCITCPPNAVCGGNATIPVPQAGYWVENAETYSVIFECIPPEACPGGDFASCADGYTGYACGSCEDDYYRSGSACNACPAAVGWQVPLIIILVLAFAIYILKKARPSDVRTKMSSVKIGFSYLQIIALFYVFPVQWHSSTETMYQTIAVSNFNVEIFAPECTISMDYFDQWFLKMMSPLILVALLLFLYLFFQTSVGLAVYRKLIFKKTTPHEMKNRFTYVCASLLSLSYTFFVSTATEPWNCSMQDNGQSTMRAESSTLCYEGKWNDWFAAEVFFFILYGIVLPIILGVHLWTRVKLSPNKAFALLNDDFRQTMGAYTLAYREQFYYWELVSFLRKLLIILLINTLSDSPFQIIFVLFILFSFLILQVFVSPYEFNWNNRLAFLWMLFSIFVMFVAIIYSDPNADSDSDTALVFGIFLLVGLGIALMSSAFVLYKEMRRWKMLVLQYEEGTQTTTERTREERNLLEDLFPGVGIKIHRRVRNLAPQERILFFDAMREIKKNDASLEDQGDKIAELADNVLAQSDDLDDLPLPPAAPTGELDMVELMPLGGETITSEDYNDDDSKTVV